MVPAEALEENPFLVHFSGITSKATAKKKLRAEKMTIGDNNFRVPYTYSFSMKIGKNIQMILGCNFIRDMQGGVRIEGNTVTFYKNLTTINTLPFVSAAAAIEELDLEEENYIQIKELINYSTGLMHKGFQDKFGNLLAELKAQGYIGEDPLRHWGKNQVLCQLDIKNSDFIVEDRPLKHLTPQARESFSKHIL